MRYATYDDSFDSDYDRPRAAPGARPYVLGVSLAIAAVVSGATGIFVFDRIEHLPGIEARAQPGEYSQPLAQDSQEPPQLMAMTPQPIPMAMPVDMPVTPDTTDGQALRANLSDQDAQQVTDTVDRDDTQTTDTTPVVPTQDETPAPASEPVDTDNSPVQNQGVN